VAQKDRPVCRWQDVRIKGRGKRRQHSLLIRKQNSKNSTAQWWIKELNRLCGSNVDEPYHVSTKKSVTIVLLNCSGAVIRGGGWGWGGGGGGGVGEEGGGAGQRNAGQWSVCVCTMYTMSRVIERCDLHQEAIKMEIKVRKGGDVGDKVM